MFLRISLFLMLVIQLNANAQEDLTIPSIPKGLTEGANAVIRLDRTDITISSRRSMNIKERRVVTILNEMGMGYIRAAQYFDKSTSIKDIRAVVYNASGQEVKKIKEKDFKERAISEGSVITDNKLLYLDYTPVQYPFTIVYTSEIQTTNTAFIPRWSPVEGPYASVEKAVFTIKCDPDLGFRYKEYNFTDVKLDKQDVAGMLTLSASNIPAAKREDYAPSDEKMVPHVLFAIKKFHLEGVDGEADSWEAFGTWIYNSLLAGTDEISPETQAKIRALVANEADPLKKAKIVYEYVQAKTRYISIQLGIGGWKPMLAKDVDRLGYGDCKALTNYTRVLLKAVGVESYYTVIYGDTDKRDLTPDFVSMQGNHIILAIPDGGKYVWLECTSQVAPFGFQGDFTDDRMALLVKPEKSELVRTAIYDKKGNTQVSKGGYAITGNGGINGAVVITSKGTQYDNRYTLESKSKDELDEIYKKGFSHINNLKLKKTALKNNKDTQEFTEDIVLEAENYCSKSGERMMFAVNAFNQSSNIPQRYRDRKSPFEIPRGFYDTDEITIYLPRGFTMEAQPQNITITDKFGEYTAEYVMVSPEQMLFKRSLLINEGFYDSNEYENYRQFREKIARNDNAKVVLVKNAQ
jgi:transglutaminase-like putative cysteine protease